jgi:hypothetical protein
MSICRSVKRYIVRLIQDPTGLVKPVMDVWIPNGYLASTWFESEEEALEAINNCNEPGCGMYYMVIPIYITRVKAKMEVFDE